MKTQQELEAKLKEIEEDERINYPLATLSINAPLVLIQLGLTSKADILRWALGLPLRKYHGED